MTPSKQFQNLIILNPIRRNRDKMDTPNTITMTVHNYHGRSLNVTAIEWKTK